MKANRGKARPQLKKLSQLPLICGQDLRQRLDEVLSEAVGVGSLGGDHQDIAGLDGCTEVEVSPHIMGRAQRAQDVAGIFR